MKDEIDRREKRSVRLCAGEVKADVRRRAPERIVRRQEIGRILGLFAAFRARESRVGKLYAQGYVEDVFELGIRGSRREAYDDTALRRGRQGEGAKYESDRRGEPRGAS